MQEFAPGTVLLDRYQLTSVLGRGAMGHVWQGRDLRLERPVAVKTVATDLLAVPRSREEALRRFQREAKAAARLHHPNTTTVFDASITDEDFGLVKVLSDTDPRLAPGRRGVALHAAGRSLSGPRRPVVPHSRWVVLPIAPPVLCGVPP